MSAKKRRTYAVSEEYGQMLTDFAVENKMFVERVLEDIIRIGIPLLKAGEAARNKVIDGALATQNCAAPTPPESKSGEPTIKGRK